MSPPQRERDADVDPLVSGTQAAGTQAAGTPAAGTQAAGTHAAFEGRASTESQPLVGKGSDECAVPPLSFSPRRGAPDDEGAQQQ
jgi:hypothetical protein